MASMDPVAESVAMSMPWGGTRYGGSPAAPGDSDAM